MNLTKMTTDTYIVETGGYSTKRSVANCSTCKYENTNMECEHPDRDKKGFVDVEMRECWSFSGRLSTGQKAADRAEGR